MEDRRRAPSVGDKTFEHTSSPWENANAKISHLAVEMLKQYIVGLENGEQKYSIFDVQFSPPDASDFILKIKNQTVMQLEVFVCKVEGTITEVHLKYEVHEPNFQTYDVRFKGKAVQDILAQK